MFIGTPILFVAETDETALELELERSRAARLRAWAVLGELRTILTGAAQELPKPAEKSFVKEGEILGARPEAGAR
jgi:hypothetical protein